MTIEGVPENDSQIQNEEHDHSLLAKKVININSLIPTSYDYMSFSYTGDNITTIIYKLGGATGTTVATLTLTWSGTNITSVTKT